ncbi:MULTISPECIES: hypothetical protein [unclassified Variovorax]|nr:MULTISPECIES: hypothetical protein [unclassified Variovorax]
MIIIVSTPLRIAASYALALAAGAALTFGWRIAQSYRSEHATSVSGY